MKWEQATGPPESLQHTLQERRPEPIRAEPGAFHCEITNFVDRIDLTQSRAEFKTIENDQLRSESSGTITFSDSCMSFVSHFAFAYRVAYPVYSRDACGFPGVTREFSVPCRQQTPRCDG